MIVERVAKQHLDWEDARREVREALEAVESFGQRDPIESRRTIFEPCLTRRTSTLAWRSASHSRIWQAA